VLSGFLNCPVDCGACHAGVAAQDVLELMLVTQYFDMLREVGANHKANTILTPGPGGDGDASLAGQLSSALRTSQLEAGCAQSMSRA